MTALHSKGPWVFVPWHIEEGPPAVRSPDGWIVATTSSDADARLIAAAPELLEALEYLTNELLVCPWQRPTPTAIQKARKALTKAGAA